MLKGSKYPAYKTTIKFVLSPFSKKNCGKTTKITIFFHGFGILIKKQQREHPPRMALVAAKKTRLVCNLRCLYSPNICSACSFTLISLGCIIRVITPSSLMTNVVRNVPKYLRPYMLFSPQTPNSSTNLCSVSAMSGNGKSFFSMNFLCDFSSFMLTPTTA